MIPEPWIVPYLVNAGEHHGGSLSSVPPYIKKRKVRWTETLSYDASDPDALIWVKLSDHVHELPARLSRAAVTSYNLLNPNVSIITQQRALLSISDFRPIFTRVPVADNVKRMSAESHLALEVGSMTVIGSAGEDHPVAKDIETDPKILTWTHGMREDGGGGNILKRMKECQDTGQIVPIAKSSRASTAASSTSTRSTEREKTKSRSGTSSVATKPNVLSPKKNNTLTIRAKWLKKWGADARPGPENQRPERYRNLLAGISLTEDSEGTGEPQDPPSPHSILARTTASKRSPAGSAKAPEYSSDHRSSSARSTTPLSWSPSVAGSPRESDIHEPIPGQPTTPPTEVYADDAHHPDQTTPRGRSEHPQDPSQSPPAPASVQQLNSSKTAPRKSGSSPKPSPAHPSSSAGSESSLSQPYTDASGRISPSSRHPQLGMKRKVPHPNFCAPPPDPERSRILVPNSDTSGSQPRTQDDGDVSRAASVLGSHSYSPGQSQVSRQGANEVLSSRGKESRTGSSTGRGREPAQRRVFSVHRDSGASSSQPFDQPALSEKHAIERPGLTTGSRADRRARKTTRDRHEEIALLSSSPSVTDAKATSKAAEDSKSVQTVVAPQRRGTSLDRTTLLGLERDGPEDDDDDDAETEAVLNGLPRPGAGFADERWLESAVSRHLGPADSSSPSSSIEGEAATDHGVSTAKSHDAASWNRPSFLRRLRHSVMPGHAHVSSQQSTGDARADDGGRPVTPPATPPPARTVAPPPVMSIVRLSDVPRLDLADIRRQRRKRAHEAPPADSVVRDARHKRLKTEMGTGTGTEPRGAGGGDTSRMESLGNGHGGLGDPAVVWSGEVAVKDEPVEVGLGVGPRRATTTTTTTTTRLPKLRGFELNFELKGPPPPPLTLQMVTDIILRAGRARHAQGKRESAEGVGRNGVPAR